MHATQTVSLSIFAAAFLFAACSSDTIPAPSAGENGLNLLEPAASDGLQLRVVAPGSTNERSICRNVIVPADVDVEKIEHENVAAGTYVAVYRVGDLFNQFDASPDGVPTNEIFECNIVPGPALYVRGGPAGNVSFPQGVGAHLPKGTVLRIEGHFLPSQTTNDARVNLTFAKSAVQADAGGLFFYDFNILVPPGGTATAKMRCQVPQDINIVQLAPLAHVALTGMRAWLSPPFVPREAVTSSTSIQILNVTGFMDLATRTPSTAIPVPRGAFIDYECDYQNPAGTALVEGPATLTNEACALAASYYPRTIPGAEMCLLPGSGSAQEGGTLKCGEVLGCQQMAGGAETDMGRACALNVCPGSQAALNGVQACFFQACQTCLNEAECNFCLQFACGNLLTLCLISGCP